jgi:hypothetical protein
MNILQFTPQGKEGRPRRIFGVDPRRVRFLHSRLHVAGDRRGIRRESARRGVRDLPDACDALHRRVHLRPARGQIRPQTTPDARYRLFLRAGRRRSLRADACSFSRPARPVWYCHGRRMGAGFVFDDGVDPSAVARHRLWHPAMRLSHGVPARLDRLRRLLRRDVLRDHVRLARDVPVQLPSRADGAVHPVACSGIPGVRRGADEAQARIHRDNLAPTGACHCSRSY